MKCPACGADRAFVMRINVEDTASPLWGRLGFVAHAEPQLRYEFEVHCREGCEVVMRMRKEHPEVMAEVQLTRPSSMPSAPAIDADAELERLGRNCEEMLK
jgi:hypothetical protein